MERPDVNLIGIEKSLHYHRVIRDRVLKRDLRNVRLINHDAFLVLRKMIPDASIAEVHIYFPDPWPRKKEQKRRIIRPRCWRRSGACSSTAGCGIYVTDHQEYFEAPRRCRGRVPRASAASPGRTTRRARTTRRSIGRRGGRFTRCGSGSEATEAS